MEWNVQRGFDEIHYHLNKFLLFIEIHPGNLWSD